MLNSDMVEKEITKRIFIITVGIIMITAMIVGSLSWYESYKMYLMEKTYPGITRGMNESPN